MKTQPYYWKERKSWYIYYVNAQGKRAKRKIGDTKEEAFAEYRRMLILSDAVDQKPASDPLFEDVSLIWLEKMEQRLEQGDVSVTWLERVSGTIGRWNRDHPGLLVSQMTPLRAQSWLDKPSANYQRTELGALAQCLAWALTHKVIQSNPLATLELPGMQAKVAIVDHEAQQAVMEHAKHLGPLLQMAWLTGCRPGELRQLKWEQIADDQSEATLLIHKTARKTKAVRRVFFNEQARKILDSLPKRHAYVFLNSRKRPWTSNAVVQAMRKISAKAGVKITAGMYRHTYATNALAKGVPIATVAELLGHSSTVMVSRVYGHLSEKKDHLRKAAMEAAELPQHASLSEPSPPKRKSKPKRGRRGLG